MGVTYQHYEKFVEDAINFLLILLVKIHSPCLNKISIFFGMKSDLLTLPFHIVKFRAMPVSYSHVSQPLSWQRTLKNSTDSIKSLMKP